MNASIVVPWKDLGCPYRRRALEHATAFWRHHLPDLELVVESGPEPFTRARALNAAVARATGDVLFEVGPDGIVTPASVREALALAAGSDGLFVCHDRYLHLTRAATERLVARPVAADWPTFGHYDCEETGTTSVDVSCFRRSTWEMAGGYDERFGLWGGDDGAFAIACAALAGPGGRVPGRWVHLWHPRHPDSVPGTRGYTEQFALLSEYVEANKIGPDAVRRVVAGR